ncbi:MAG: endonuclease [Prevotella sp.]|nr:endonuclease [Prevotella sp.]
MKKWYMTCCLLTAMTLAWAQGPNNTGTYYKNADGESGEALKTALSAIITKGHTKIGYDGLYNSYKKTDSRPDGMVRDWYSNATNFTHVTDKAGSYSKEGDCYNREHCLPQSWYEGGGNADYLKCDIVHVLPTDGYINGRRGNNVLANVNPNRISGQSKNGYSKWGQCGVSGYSGTVFEPNDEIKGDIARIYFYVVTRYESNCTKWASNATANAVFTSSSSYQPFKDWYYKMLVEWAQNDPIDDVEIARNNAVHREQGNRNPFVDYPGLEEYIWGDKKNEPFDYDNYNATVAVRTPTFSPDGGTFTSPQSVTISCATDGATIYYTIDGTTPTASSTPYTKPITVSESLTLMAIAVKDDEQSSVATASFVISDGGDDPTPTGDNIYKKVTSTSDLESGKRYLIVYEEGGKALLRLDGKAGTGSVSITSDAIDLNNKSNQAMVLVFNKVGNEWTIKGSDGNFMALTSNSNALNTATTADDNTAKWTISISGGTATISNVQYSGRRLQYNYNSGNDMFRCYTGSQKDVTIFKETTSTTDIQKSSVSSGKNREIYNLQGRKISGKPAKKGVYVRNGKKVVMK